MATETWTVRLAEVFEDQRPNEEPRALTSFGVEGKNVDAAKAAAKKWLVDAGKKVRSIAVCSPITSRTISAVIMVKR